MYDAMPGPSQRIVARVINAAARDINAALAAYNAGTFSAPHLGYLQRAHTSVAALLGAADRYGGFPDYKLDLLDTYERMAADLLEAVVFREDCQDEQQRLPNKRYAVSRRILIDGRAYQEATACNNPAVGWAHLDRWEAEVRRSVAMTGEA